jgi:hypothetical protein
MAGFTRSCILGLLCSWLAICLPVAAQQAQQPGDAEVDRSVSEIGPGVLTVIAPLIEEEETLSRLSLAQVRRDLAFKNWTPEYGAPARTLYERALKAQLRRPVWALEFTFKPFRLVHVDIPQANGKMQRKPIWYMVYRVRYLGREVHPSANEQVVEQSKFTKYLAERRDVDARRFVSQFVLRDHSHSTEYLDRVIPAARDEIQQRERIGTLYNTVEISGVAIPVSDAQTGKGVWGVVTWEDIDPRCDFFSVYIQGLTNAYRFQTAPDGTRRGPLEQKTLQLNFYRPGDSVLEHEDEFRYGIPDNPTQQRLTHVVERGDSLMGLAKRYLGDERRADEIYQANRDVLAAADKLPEGVLILIPTVDFSDLQQGIAHVIKEGDSLAQLAARYLGDPARADAIFKFNRRLLVEPDKLPLGEQIIIPLSFEPPSSELLLVLQRRLYSARQRLLFNVYGVPEQVRSQWIYRPGTLAQPAPAQ